MNKTAIIYARVSSKEQEKGYSIDAQLKLLRGYAFERGFSVAQEFVDIETAKKAGRTNFNLMLAYLEENPGVKTILVEKTDRLYRNFKDYAFLEDYGLEIHLVKENQIIHRDSRSSDKFIHGINVLRAKNFSDNLSEEVKKGLLEKVEQGGYPRSAPFGYTNNIATKTIEIEEAASYIVRCLFEWYATGNYSLKGLRQRVKEEGLLANYPKHRVGVAGIHKFLSSAVYYGMIPFRGKLYQGNHEPIISKALFDKVQEVLMKRSRTQGKTVRSFPYMGYIVCAECGCAITAEIAKKKYVYYHCTNGKGGCSNKSTYLREELLDQSFANILKSIHIDEERLEWIKDALKSNHAEERAYHEQSVAGLQKSLNIIENKIHQAYEDKLDGNITVVFWQSKMDEWTKEQDRLLSTIELHQKADRKYLETGISLLELASRASELYLKQNSQERKKMLKLVLSNSKLEGKNVVFAMRKPFDMIAQTNESENWLALAF